MTDLEQRLGPPPTKPVSSVARITDDWYVACRASELRKRPLGVTVLGIPLVLFRGERGEPTALLDRCPHRNVPLSLGKLTGGQLQCAYHGWRFDTAGQCRLVPGSCVQQEAKGRRVARYATREQDGYVWVYATPDVEPAREPFRFPLMNDPRYSTVRYELEVDGSVHSTAENALDVPHTAFLHRGLFRQAELASHVIDVEVRRFHDRVEAAYIGEPRPPGVVGRVLAPGGGTVEHVDRFFLPCVAQVEYRLGSESHLYATTALTPLSDYRTKMFAAATFRLPIPHALIVPVMKPIAVAILRQDARMLHQQTAAVRRFGGEQYVSTEIDVLGPHIWRLLRQAERGERQPTAEPFVRRVQMKV